MMSSACCITPSNRTLKSLAVVLLLSAGCLSVFASPQGETDTFNQQLAQLSALNSLDAANLPPWHMQVSYTRFDSKDGINGSLELWSLGKDQMRVELTEPDRKGTYLLSATGRLRSRESKLLPQDLAFLLQDLIHPYPKPQIFEVEKTEDTDFGPLPTKCLLERPQSVSRSPDESLGKLPSFCVDDTGALRFAWFQDGIKVENGDSQHFGDHLYPKSAKISFRDRPMVDARVESLESWKGTVDLASANFVPDVFTGPVRVSSGVIQSMLLANPAPHYPQSAKRDHITGTVTLAIRIGTDGSIQDLSVLSAPRDDLAVAATEAVRRWTYKPYFLNGVPVQVNSTVMLNFNLAP